MKNSYYLRLIFLALLVLSTKANSIDINHNIASMAYVRATADVEVSGVSGVTVEGKSDELQFDASFELTDSFYVSLGFSVAEGDYKALGTSIADFEADGGAINSDSEFILGVQAFSGEADVTLNSGAELNGVELDSEELVLGVNIGTTDGSGVLGLSIEIDSDDTSEVSGVLTYTYYSNGVGGKGLGYGIGVESYDDGESYGFGLGWAF